jgi:hypothetical protein
MLICLEALFVFNDFIFAFLPLAFIFKIRRSLTEKILLVFFMGFGLFASACAAVKIALTPEFFMSEDYFYSGVTMGIFAHLEAHLGIIAACLPCLKAPVTNFLRRFGLFSDIGVSPLVDLKSIATDSDQSSAKRRSTHNELDANSGSQEAGQTSYDLKQSEFVTNNLHQVSHERLPEP